MNLLILDLDETLIHATRVWERADYSFIVGPYLVYIRPHVERFLKSMAEHYEIAVWTSSSDEYASKVISELPFSKNPGFIWTRDRCTPAYDHEKRERFYIKDLKKLRRLGYDLDRVLVVDDSAGSASRNYGNLVRVKPYGGEPEDRELILLERYLISIAGRTDLRSFEKRVWRKQVTE